MEAPYFEDQNYQQAALVESPLIQAHYDYCRFTGCNLERYDLSGYKFTDCTFTDCNLSLANLAGCSFQDIKFINCKLLGLHFEACNPFNISFSFQDCILDHSSFFKLKIKKTIFLGSRLQEVEFEGADLTQADFQRCDLQLANFFQTNLEQANFINAENFSIDPDSNKIKGAKFGLQGLPGLLEKHQLKIQF